MEHADARVDAFLYKAADFAQPILTHLRGLVHTAYLEIRETIKWGLPFFEHKGSVCHMSTFKQHYSFGLSKASLLRDPFKLINPGEEAAAGSFGRITSLSDLPSDKILLTYIRVAVKLNEDKVKVAPGFLNAKTDATRLKRMETALKWIREGKSRHWRYR